MALYFSNSNIAPADEFDRRAESAKKLAEADGVEFVVDPPDHADWLEKVAKGYENEPEKGARCERCFKYNLARTAKYAREHGFEAFTTSLTVSPHKVSKFIFYCGETVASRDCGFMEIDFKKKDGFLKSLARSAELGLYRQRWCGCEFSRHGEKDAAPEAGRKAGEGAAASGEGRE